MSDVKTDIELEQEFIEQFVNSEAKPCPCANPNCRTLRYEKKGKLLERSHIKTEGLL